MHGYSAPQIKSWSPETDAYAPYLRARVPLAKRIPAFEPTQARRGLDPRPKLMSLANDYVQPGNVTEGYPYGPGFEAYALRFWQYPDLYASWHGLPLEGEHDADEPRYGLLNLPNPGYTEAAHRNGVLSLGCWFWPRPEDFSEVVERRPDGSFPMVDKLIEMAGYFGFDGYFINQEAVIPAEQAELLMEFFVYFAGQAPDGFHLQWYDSLTVDGRVSYQNEFNSVNSPWIVSEDGTRICDSIFLNYWWNAERVKRSQEHALALGLDPYEVVYTGQEIGLNRFAQPYDPRHIFPEGEEPRTSWAYLGAEMVWYTVGGDKDTVEAQAPAYERERHLWCGPLQDPSRTGRLADPDPADPHDPRGWDGTAHNIVEKSVIGALPFETSFCAGTGTGFFVDGARVSDEPWFNIGIQDVLPTWQWWVRDGDDEPSDSVSVDYDYATAYDGGTSLLLAGSLDAAESAVVRLYKTALPVGRTTVIDVVHDAGAGDIDIEIGLLLDDAPEQWEWLPLAGSARDVAGGWSRSSRPLAQWAGRTVVAIGVAVRAGDDAVGEFEVRLGQLAISDRGPAQRPASPRDLTVDRVTREGDVASVYLRWSAARNAAHYDLFHGTGAQRTWVGRTHGEAFCASALNLADADGRQPMEVEAVTAEGRRSAPARVWLD
jgi:endo-beta-N-acetylglucosaminidase D